MPFKRVPILSCTQILNILYHYHLLDIWIGILYEPSNNFKILPKQYFRKYKIIQILTDFKIDFFLIF